MNPKALAKLRRAVVERSESVDEPDDDDPRRRPRNADYSASLAPGGARVGLVERACDHKTRAGRTSYVVELIGKGVWRTALVPQLAEVWNLDRSSVHAMAAEAYRYVRGAFGDREQIRTQCMTILENVIHDAANAGDGRTVVAAVRTIADITGLVVTKHEITGSIGITQTTLDLTSLTDEELARELLRVSQSAEVAETSNLIAPATSDAPTCGEVG